MVDQGGSGVAPGSASTGVKTGWLTCLSESIGTKCAPDKKITSGRGKANGALVRDSVPISYVDSHVRQSFVARAPPQAQECAKIEPPPPSLVTCATDCGKTCSSLSMVSKYRFQANIGPKWRFFMRFGDFTPYSHHFERLRPQFLKYKTKIVSILCLGG